MRHATRVMALSLLVAGDAWGAAGPRPFETGADLSSLLRLEASGAGFRDSAGAADAVVILARNGFTAVRLRLWHSPAGGECGLDSTLAMARRAHADGLRVLLDLHLSDTWADPGHQLVPAAWRGLTAATLADSVREYARGVVRALVEQGTPPAWV